LVVSRALKHQSQRLDSHKVCGIQQRFVAKVRVAARDVPVSMA
jgi:hypothetical protein